MEEEFLAVTGETDDSVARQYLEMSGKNLEVAVSLYLDHHTGSVQETAIVAELEHETGDQIEDEAKVQSDLLSFDDLSTEPDYDYLADDCDINDASMPSTPDYDNIGADCKEDNTPVAQTISISAFPTIPTATDLDNIGTQDQQQACYEEIVEEDFGDEYILGTLMIRVLQARNLRPNPHSSGGIGTLLSNHRRARHQRATMSPASGGNITPLSSKLHPYAKMSFRGDTQITSTAFENSHGDYHWSRSDQSYFDVTCSSFPLRMDKMHQSKSHQSFKSKHSSSQQSSPKKETSPKEQYSPMLKLSLFSKASSSNKHKKQFAEDTNHDDYLVGNCSINILRILSGKTPYFDEWCTLHNDKTSTGNQNNEAGRVRIVIEYEPTDPPPRAGDVCVFANVYPVDDELYPVPLYTIKNVTRPIRSSASMSSVTTASSVSLSSDYSRLTTVVVQPKTFLVDEVVGDYVVLLYKTPEGWNCTFEVHRYLLLCIERYQAVVEKCKDQVLDLCDNLSQSPMVDIISKKIESLPDEGLVFVGSDTVGSSVDVLGRWLANGVDVALEDVVDGLNLDGRYSHPEEEEDSSSSGQIGYDHTEVAQTTEDSKSNEPLPGMPCCPITGIPMTDPVVASDGHTYQRDAIERWMKTSMKSPLTGEVLSSRTLVPNYMLIGLSSVVKRSE